MFIVLWWCTGGTWSTYTVYCTGSCGWCTGGTWSTYTVYFTGAVVGVQVVHAGVTILYTVQGAVVGLLVVHGVHIL